MHQTWKGQQWYFGTKLHIGADSKLPLIHSMDTTAANSHDGKMLGGLLHGNETRVYGDPAYRGQNEVIRAHAPNAKDFTTGASAIAAWSMRRSAPGTARSPGCRPRSSIRSG